MNYIIRNLEKSEYMLLNDFLYEAIFIPEGTEVPPREIINKPELKLYVSDFGKKDDNCLVAEKDSKIIGCCWCRIINDYGHIDDETPSIAISLLKEYRGLGIGTVLMQEMLMLLRNKGYEKVSLSVQKKNFALKLYLKCGFRVVDENEDDYIMVRDL